MSDPSSLAASEPVYFRRIDCYYVVCILHFPAGIWCENDVGSTSMRRHHVASTLIRRHFGTKCRLGSDAILPGRVAQSVGHLTRKSGVLGLIPGLATYFHFSFRFFQEEQLSVTGESMCTKYWLTT